MVGRSREAGETRGQQSVRRQDPLLPPFLRAKTGVEQAGIVPQMGLSFLINKIRGGGA